VNTAPGLFALMHLLFDCQWKIAFFTVSLKVCAGAIKATVEINN